MYGNEDQQLEERINVRVLAQSVAEGPPEAGAAALPAASADGIRVHVLRLLRSKYAGGLVLLAATLAILTSAFSPGFFPIVSDETALAWLGKEIANGRFPYRDFFSFLPPLGLYMVAGFFKVAGSSLAGLRLLSIGWIAGVTILFYMLLLRSGLKTWLAAGAALVLPGLLVPFWSVPSHHWFALGFGIAALLVAAGPRAGHAEWFTGGLLVGCAGLVVQTEGILFGFILLTRSLFVPNDRPQLPVGSLLAGAVTPVALTGSLLWLNGALESAIAQVILWPLLYYKQSGGFNDVEGGATSLAIGWTPDFAFEFLAAVVVLSIPLVLLGSLLFSPLTWRHGQRTSRERSRWVATVLGAVGATVLLLVGRTDFVHLILLAPIYLYLLLDEVDWAASASGPPCSRSGSSRRCWSR